MCAKESVRIDSMRVDSKASLCGVHVVSRLCQKVSSRQYPDYQIFVFQSFVKRGATEKLPVRDLGRDYCILK